MAKKRPRRIKTAEQVQDEADERKRLTLVAAGIPAFRVEGEKVHDYETNVKAIRVLYPMVVDRWLAEGGPGFEDPQKRAIHHCRELWHAAGNCGKLVANLDWIGGGGGGPESGWHQTEALAQLQHYKHEFLNYWNIFENVVRHNLPAGTAGSHLANNPAQAIASAKTVVGFIASKIAEARRY